MGASQNLEGKMDIEEINHEEALDKAMYHLEQLQVYLWLAGAPPHPKFDEARKVMDLEAELAKLKRDGCYPWPSARGFISTDTT